MKKILLSIMTLAVMGITAKVQAQCTPSNVVITVNSAAVVAGNMNVNFDVSFDIAQNDGNKYIYIQSWKTSQWPNYWQCVNGSDTRNPRKAPLGPDLVNSFLRLAINNDVSAPAQPTYTTYGFDGTAMTTATGISKVYNVLPGVNRITLTGVIVTIPGPFTSVDDPIAVTTDVFSTQAAGSGPNTPVHCVNCGITQYFNDPLISGIVPCSSPRVVNFQINSVRTNTQFYYRIYRDNGNGIFNTANDLDVTVGTNPTVTTNGSGLVPLAQYPIVQPPAGSLLSDYRYWIVLTQVGNVSGVSKLISPLPGVECAPLPVDFKSFTATRNNSNVLVKWETSTEVNNSGFAVERNVNGTWMQVAFVPSQASSGNSNSPLAYSFNDLNSNKGVSQYRIKQIDIDAQFKYSEVRSVRGDGQAGKIIVYPNPSSDGKVNVAFEDSKETREVSVIDMSGRFVKQFRNVTNNNITIENLAPGIYSLRVFVPATGEQAVQKIVVNKQ